MPSCREASIVMAAPHYPLDSPPPSAQQHTALPRSWPCAACHATGITGRLLPGCLACGASWQPRQFECWLECHDRGAWLMFGRNRYRWDRLPCGHRLDACLTYRDELCAQCGGLGEIITTDWIARPVYPAQWRAPSPAIPLPPIRPMRALTKPLAHRMRTSAMTSGPWLRWLRLGDWLRHNTS